MVIVVTGLPGSGKTTFAEALATRLDALYLGTDKIRQEAGLAGKYGDSQKQLVYAMLLDSLEKALLQGKNVVVDGTFYKESLRSMLSETAGRYTDALFWVEISADPLIIRARMQQPRQYSEADFLIFEKIQADYEPLQVPHLKLESDQQALEMMLDETERYCQE